MTSGPQDITEKLQQDLEKSGFAAELRVLRKFLGCGWHTEGSQVYIDQDEGVAREFDVSALQSFGLQIEGSSAGNVFGFVVGDVKKSTNPWVVFKSKSVHGYLERDSGGPLVYASNLPQPRSTFADALHVGSVVDENGWWGRAIHEAFKKPSDRSRWYSAFITVCKAGNYALERESSAEDPHDRVVADIREHAVYFLMVRPLVVLEGRLFSAELDDGGDLNIEEIDKASVQFSFSTPAYNPKRYYVDVIKEDAVDAYIEGIEARLVKLGEAIFRAVGLEGTLER